MIFLWIFLTIFNIKCCPNLSINPAFPSSQLHPLLQIPPPYKCVWVGRSIYFITTFCVQVGGWSSPPFVLLASYILVYKICKYKYMSKIYEIFYLNLVIYFSINSFLISTICVGTDTVQEEYHTTNILENKYIMHKYIKI